LNKSQDTNADQSGNLKPATDLRSSFDKSARLPMDADVSLVPADVCVVTSWMTFILSEILEAAVACCCAESEMDVVRSARCVDTPSISASESPALSASLAPSTTCVVDCPWRQPLRWYRTGWFSPRLRSVVSHQWIFQQVVALHRQPPQNHGPTHRPSQPV